MAKSMKKQEVEQSSSKRHFHWTTKVSCNNEEAAAAIAATTVNTIHHQAEMIKNEKITDESSSTSPPPTPPSSEKNGRDRENTSKKLHAVAISRLRSLFGKNGQQRVVLGTLFGNKRGTHLHFAFQKDAKLRPTLLIQLATPITGLGREMETGSVRIALESEKKKGEVGLLEERVWRTYCNGIKCGLTTRIECGAKEWKILKAVEPISTGAGVLPAEEEEDEVIYMRARFERVVGNTDSEAFYMVNPHNNLNAPAPPELSIYLLRL